MSTQDCQTFLSSHYKGMNFDTNPTEWKLQKKYKNFHGFTCRDFIHPPLGLKAIVIMNGSQNKFSVMENANYEFFVKNRSKKTLFYYVPAISNDGLVYFFVRKSLLDANFALPEFVQKDKDGLHKTLKALFSSQEIVYLPMPMVVGFPKIDVDEVIKKLETSQFVFNPKIFSLMDETKFQPFYPDLSLAVYNFPEDDKLNQEDAIEVLFKICSQRQPLIVEDYARVRNLLKKVSVDEILSVGNIMNGFRLPSDEKLTAMIYQEVSRKKSLAIFDSIAKSKK